MFPEALGELTEHGLHIVACAHIGAFGRRCPIRVVDERDIVDVMARESQVQSIVEAIGLLAMLQWPDHHANSASDGRPRPSAFKYHGHANGATAEPNGQILPIFRCASIEAEFIA